MSVVVPGGGWSFTVGGSWRCSDNRGGMTVMMVRMMWRWGRWWRGRIGGYLISSLIITDLAMNIHICHVVLLIISLMEVMIVVVVMMMVVVVEGIRTTGIGS